MTYQRCMPSLRQLSNRLQHERQLKQQATEREAQQAIDHDFMYAFSDHPEIVANIGQGKATVKDIAQRVDAKEKLWQEKVQESSEQQSLDGQNSVS